MDSSVVMRPQMVFESSEEEEGARGYSSQIRDSRNVTMRRKPAKIQSSDRMVESSEDSKLESSTKELYRFLG